MSAPEHLRQVEEAVRGLPLAQALKVVSDKLIDPSPYAKGYLAAVLKEESPEVSFSEICELLGYRPERLKSVAWSLYEYRSILAGDRGRRVFLGYHSLDRLIRGVRPGQVLGIMARAGVGKTALACNLIVNVFRRADPHPVLFFSLEMPAAEVAARLFCIDCGETGDRLDSYLERSEADSRIAAWARRFSDLVVVDEGGLGASDLEKVYAEAERYLGRRIPLAIVDYLGLLRGPGSTAYERVSNLAREIKNIAKRLSCALVVLIQTSRAGGSGGERVTLTAARDSGAVEEACDFLIGAWRPELGDEGGRPGEMVLSLLKNRHGPTGEVSLRFDRDTLRIREAD